ncbi:MAG TPA: GHMP kinase [bacterium]|nr:GHMP kinase [bacterium]
MNSSNSAQAIRASAPGRICLFGEHQDYLGLSVITAAIDLRIEIIGRPHPRPEFVVHCPDIHHMEIVSLESPVRYRKERDYFRSGIRVVQRHGVTWKTGYRCTVRGNIPINSGTSSSSALMVAWVCFLLKAGGDKRALDPLTVARIAHEAEVREFGEPGGMMDHMVSSLGSLLYIDFSSPGAPEALPGDLGSFVLGDSMEPKDTFSILSRVKKGTLEAFGCIKKEDPASTLGNLTQERFESLKSCLNESQAALLEGQIQNRNLTETARKIMLARKMDGRTFGDLLNRHHEILRDRLKISTPKIDAMLQAALKAGALGGKINGSGGGGCMFVYAPVNAEAAAEAIAQAGGKPMIIHIGPGIRVFSEKRTPDSTEMG